MRAPSSWAPGQTRDSSYPPRVTETAFSNPPWFPASSPFFLQPLGTVEINVKQKLEQRSCGLQ